LYLQQPRGFNKNLKMDFDGLAEMVIMRLQGRVLVEPYGCFDERARRRGERVGVGMIHLAPRDAFGTTLSIVEYLDPSKFDQFLLYINVLRRVRKMSATDTQDAVGGQDLIYDDREGFAHKLSPERYPYKFEVIAEREYLVPAPQWDGSGYISSKDLGLYNYEFERRPLYVVKLTQMDKNYVYSYRTLFIDKETFFIYHVDNYNQRGRLYRTTDNLPSFIPEMGLYFSMGFLARDYIDLHSVYARHFTMPATWLGREHIDMRYMIKRGK